MNLLFIHQNFPGQYLHLAPAFAQDPKHRVVALCINEPREMPGVRTIRYPMVRKPGENLHPWTSEYESKLIRGESCAAAIEKLKQEGFIPDIVVAHLGWGEGMFIKAVLPDTPVLGFMEFFYRVEGGDYSFDREFSKDSWHNRARLMSKTAYAFVSMEAMDHGISPTEWQKSTAPIEYHSKISVIHDGINTDIIKPNPDAWVTLQNAGVTMRPGDEVLTYVGRNLEPYRGFHSFMRALPEIQRRRPNVRTIIVGADGVSYGAPPPAGTTYKKMMLEEVGSKLDMSRIHFVGRLPYANFLSVLHVSAVHVYLTYPFVLSWSMMESMAAGCLLVGSRTPPVEEVLEDGKNGILCDFFDAHDIADKIVYGLENQDKLRPLRAAARDTIVSKYDLQRICLPQHVKLVQDVAGKSGIVLPPIVRKVAGRAVGAAAAGKGKKRRA